ncbi:macrophage mannose receptor 1-like [Patiria miniata]|uniref:C-type lectin domain-containing protein n=1 Tax=Patiria miniata TaxID=46514 RepID=A0A913ZMT2_PATMI|nr:macrophage mannose receptor 1-like [Patiria miniata]
MTTSVCEPPWLAWGDHCYLTVSHLEPNFYLAEDYCQGLSKPGRPAHLASVTSDEENQFIDAYATASGIKTDGFWIGYRYDGGFSWTDGSAIGFSSWRAGDPDQHLATGMKCVNTDARCKITFRQRDINKSGCEPPWLAWGNHCYLSVRARLNINKAENHCQDLSKPGRPAHMASITSEEENQFIHSYATASGIDLSKGLWIGYKRESNTRPFGWTDGSIPTYENWAPGRPINNMYNCVGVAERRSFWDADSYCQSFSTPGRSAHLVSVANVNESYFVTSYADKAGIGWRFWIGYTSESSPNGQYVWIDGSLPGFFNWIPGEPNLASEHCVKMLSADGSMNDAHCSNKEPFVCKMPAWKFQACA